MLYDLIPRGSGASQPLQCLNAAVVFCEVKGQCEPLSWRTNIWLNGGSASWGSKAMAEALWVRLRGGTLDGVKRVEEVELQKKIR